VYAEAIHEKGDFKRQVDLSAYASGVYFIKVTSDAASETKRIMLCTSELSNLH
jgi:hypothetical protein